MPRDLTIIIPTKDEYVGLDYVLAGLVDTFGPDYGGLAEVVVVDASFDGAMMRGICERYGARYVRQASTGLGNAVKEGLWVARGEWVLVMDGDGQHPPAVAGKMYGYALAHPDTDVVYGVRRSYGDMSPWRYVVSRVASALLGLLVGVRDATSGLIMFRRSLVPDPGVLHGGFKFFLPVLARHRGRIRVGYVPYDFQARQGGVSKASLWEGIRFLGLLVRCMIVRRATG